MSREPLTTEERHILRHTLGLDHRHAAPYRNHYCTTPGDPLLAGLARTGLMELVGRPSEMMPYDTYRCTDAGIAAAQEGPA